MQFYVIAKTPYRAAKPSLLRQEASETMALNLAKAR